MTSLRHVSTSIDAGPPSSWPTSTLPGGADASTTELQALGRHVERCNGLRGPMFDLQCAADSLKGFLAPRFVTSLMLGAVAVWVGSLVL